MKLPSNLSDSGICSDCGVGPLDLCDSCGEAYDRHVNYVCGRAMARARLRTAPVRALIWFVRGLVRLLEAVSGRKGS